MWEIRTLGALAAGHRAGFLLLVALGLAASFVEAFSVSLVVFLLYRTVLASQVPGAQGILSVFYNWTGSIVGDDVYILAAVIAAATLLRQAFVGTYEVVGSRVSNAVYDRLRTALFQQYLSVSYEYIATKDYGELTNTLQVETWRVSQAIENLSRILINGCAMLVYMLVLFFISWPVALAAVGSGIVVMGLTQLFRGSLRALSRKATQLHEQLAERMFTSIQAMRTIRTHGVEMTEIARFAGLSRAVAHVFVRLAVIDNACRPFLEVAALAAVGAVVWTSSVIGNSTATTVAVVALLFRLQPQIREMQGRILSLMSAEASIAVVVASLDQANKPYPPVGFRHAAPFRSELAFYDVTFVHAESVQPSLDHVSFSIARGMTAAIIGPSGAGKTTIVNLLLKLYEPTTGTIAVDGVLLGEIERSAWLKRIAITGQDIDLLEGTILDNIRMANPGASVVEAKDALQVAGLLDFVEQLPDGLQTYVGERGFRLSGGQRQRIGLARAIVGNPDILILDEATNAIDPGLEVSIHAALRSAFPRLTIIVVAHRSSALSDAKLVIVLDHGRVSITGSPAMLRGRSEPAFSALL